MGKAAVAKKPALRAKPAAAAGTAALAKKRYKVVAHPHLGLGLELGAAYSLQELEEKCQGKSAKIKKLAEKMVDGDYFQAL